VCIVTPDIVGVVKNGGIGTSFAHTADILVANGFEVDILFSNAWMEIDDAVRDEAIDRYRQRGINLRFLFDDAGQATLKSSFPRHPALIASFLAYQRLKDAGYDVIVFPEWKSPGYHSMVAKSQGLAFADTALVIQTHSSTLWHLLNNRHSNFRPADVVQFRLERETVRLADVVISPTQYLLDWKAQHGFTFPEHTYVQPYLLNFDDPDTAGGQPVVPDEFVFFGRLEERKGLRYFLQAAQRFIRDAEPEDLDNLTITFLGKLTGRAGENSMEKITEATADWPVRVKVLSTLSAEEALDYLKAANRVAMICSTADNSPLTVLECLYGGVPFLATSIGGIPELLESSFHESHLMPLRAPEIAERMLKVRRLGHTAAAPATTQATNNIPTWVEAVGHLPRVASKPVVDTEPRVTVCITHYNRAELLERTLEGVKAQTYRNFELIIVDDGSTDPDAVRFLEAIENGEVIEGARVLRQQNQYVGAARNRALSEASGEYVVFMDDDNLAREDQLELFVRAIENSQADAISCVAVMCKDDEFPLAGHETLEHLYIPPGGGASAAVVVANPYGDANAIYRRSALESVGGYTEDYGLSWEDAELFHRLEVEGFAVTVLPEPLMWLRHAEGTVSRSSDMMANLYRAMRPHLEHLPWDTWGDALLVAASFPLEEMARQSMVGVPSGPQRDEIAGARRRLNKSESGTVENVRAVGSYLCTTGHSSQGRDVLFDTADSDPDAGELYVDFALVASETGFGDEAKRRLESAGENCHREVALALLDLEKTGQPERVGEALRRACAEAPEVPAYQLFHGILTALTGGDSREAMNHIAGAFDADAADYLARYPDVASEVGDQGSALRHYLNHGMANNKSWPVSAPTRNPFARHASRLVDEKLSEAKAARLAVNALHLDWVGANHLWNRMLVADHLLPLGLVSRRMLSLADHDYFADNDDVRVAVESGTLASGFAHFAASGHAEGRDYPTPEVLVRWKSPAGNKRAGRIRSGAGRLAEKVSQ
jgi:GT2 family glycosyltransferase/glycosyltransferase involved in cell wall biosynthesis